MVPEEGETITHKTIGPVTFIKEVNEEGKYMFDVRLKNGKRVNCYPKEFEDRGVVLPEDEV